MSTGADTVEDILARAELQASDGNRSEHRSWRRVDLANVLSGDYTPPKPTVGARSDGVGLFYPGRVHSVASESEAGKTWLALQAAKGELAAGNAVVYIDFEDDEAGVVGRLIALGADPEHIRARFAYIRPEERLDALGNLEDLVELLGELKPTLVVLDGVTEAMALHNLELKDNTDVAKFGNLLPGWIAARGPAVVALDHVVKDTTNQGRYAIGGAHKLNGLNGAAYILKNRTPFTIGGTGRSSIYVAKDRPGQVRQHAVTSGKQQWFGDLVMTSLSETSVDLAVVAPTQGGDEFRPTEYMGRIAAVLEADGPLSQRAILDRTKGNRGYRVTALKRLIEDGYVSEAPHKLLKPYPSEE
jgi:hypothetical protein